MNMNILAAILFFTIGTLAVSACSEQQPADKARDDAKTETAVEHAKKHLDPTYVCPMHPNIIRDKPGNCPICGMDLVKVEAEAMDTSSKEKKILYWVAPMDPNYRRNEPGKSPMGMDLVPVYDEGGGTDVRISPAVVDNLGVRTATVQRDRLWRKINTVGYIDFDENRIVHIHLRTKGWIDRLHVKSQGERVRKGQLLFEVYSPELVNAQDEYVQALQSGHRRLTDASRERLLALGVSQSQVNQLKATRKVNQYIKVYASQDGIIADLNVREGMFVMPNVEVMSLADLSSIWILAEVFEAQADWVAVGQATDVTLPYKPGRSWEGKVEYIYPSLNPKTRTLRVRLRFDNPDEVLKPNMFAHVAIYGGAKRDVLIVPSEAVIRTGNAARVILDMGDGRFRAREVVIGIESGDWIEIQRGLTEGDKVVTSGQFLIDSEASLKASIQRMSTPAEKTPEAPPSEPMPDQSNVIEGVGVIQQLFPSENKLNLTHEPIAALKWPQMTMDFRVSPDLKLDGFKPRDKVTFELEKDADGYVISRMRVRAE